MAQSGIQSMTDVSGAIHNDTIWTNDTVNVIGDIYVPDSVTLTINAGTVVLFDDQYEIDVQGCVIAQGAVGDSIIFTVADTTGYYMISHTGWKGFQFNNTPTNVDTSIFSFCKFLFTKNSFTNQSTFYVDNFSNLIIENSRFSYNYHSSSAPSCINVENNSSMLILNNLFTHNDANYGVIELGCSSSGDILNPLIANNVFKYNIGYSLSSCIKISGNASSKIINNVFQYNYCAYKGGAMVISGYSTPTIIGNLITNNYAEGNGGAISVQYYASPKIINNTIVNNYSEEYGGAISVGCYTSNILFQNNIIWGNEADYDGDQLYFNNEYFSAGYSILNNIIQGGDTAGIYFEYTFGGICLNNLNVLPAFADSTNHDYHLTCASPAINAGTQPLIPIFQFDLDNNPRLNGLAYDIGAYEHVAYANILTHPQNTSVMTGTVANFIVGSDYSTAFQWQESTNLGSTWSDLSDDATYSGTSTNSLSINAVYTMNGNLYRCQVTGSCPLLTNTSNPAILVVDYNVGINEIDNPIIVYPNPSKENIFITNAEGANLIISDMNGRVIETFTNIASDKEMINLSNYAEGMYILRVIQAENISIIKLIKE